jgi:hypothetical protein
MHRNGVPVCEGSSKGLRGRILSRGPVEGTGEQRPKHGAAVVLVEQCERLRRPTVTPCPRPGLPCAACSRRARRRVLASAVRIPATRQQIWVDPRSRWSPSGQALPARGLMAHGPGWRGRPATTAGSAGAGRSGSTRDGWALNDYGGPPSWLEGQHALITEQTAEAALAFSCLRRSTMAPWFPVSRIVDSEFEQVFDRLLWWDLARPGPGPADRGTAAAVRGAARPRPDHRPRAGHQRRALPAGGRHQGLEPHAAGAAAPAQRLWSGPWRLPRPPPPTSPRP